MSSMIRAGYLPTSEVSIGILCPLLQNSRGMTIPCLFWLVFPFSFQRAIVCVFCVPLLRREEKYIIRENTSQQLFLNFFFR